MGPRPEAEGSGFRIVTSFFRRRLRHDELEAGGGELVVVNLDLDLLEVAVLVLDGDVAGLR